MDSQVQAPDEEVVTSIAKTILKADETPLINKVRTIDLERKTFS